MKIAVTVAMSFVLQCFCITIGEIAKVVSGCSASAGKLMEEATVTCFIPETINHRDLRLKVHHNSLHSNKVAVSRCSWEAGNWTCIDNSGYKSGTLTKESFTLRIPNVTQNHTGNYTCALNEKNNGHCTLEIRPDDGLTTDQLSSATTGFSTTNDMLTTHMSTTKETPSFQALHTAIPVLLTVSLVVVVISITLSLWCCWRRRRQKTSRTPGSEDKESANTEQRDNLINRSKDSEDLSTLPSTPSGDFTDRQTCKDQLTFLDEDQKQAPCPEVLSTPREKRDSQQTPQQSIPNVIELLKNLPLSPGISDGPPKSLNKQITKFTYQAGADGSVKIALESNLSCPENLSEKEDVSLGQNKIQQESSSNEDKEQTSVTASKACIVNYRETELKSSIDVQEEQMTTDVHKGFVDPKLQVIQHEDSMNFKQSPELKKAAQEDNRLVDPSSPPDVVSPAGDLSPNTANNFSETPEETSKLLGKWSVVDQDSQSQTLETQVDPEILLSHLTTATKLSEDNMEQEESSPVNESDSATRLLKVRTVQ